MTNGMESLQEAVSEAQEWMGYLYSAASLDEVKLPITWSGQRLCLVALSCTLLTYFTYYLGWVVSKPRVIGTGKLKEKLLRSCPILSECYWPTFWALQCHLSTLTRFLLQKTPDTQYRREILTLGDGGEVALDWGEGSKTLPEVDLSQDDMPVLLVMPGITGCSWDNYVQHLVEDGLMEGYRPVVFNQRGNGGVRLKTNRTYSASDITDLFEVVQYIYSCYPGTSIVGVGVSLGGMLLTQYLHQLGKECNISVVISISASWDPFISRKSLEDVPINKVLYSRVMVNNLKTIVKRNLDQMTSEEREKFPYDIKKIMTAQVVSDIDTCLTAPLFGFSSLEDYYKFSQNSDKIHKIRTPLICVAAEDDPFVPKETLPLEEIERNPHTVMVVTSRGGHFGFLEGLYPNYKTWMDRTMRQILTAFKSHDEFS